MTYQNFQINAVDNEAIIGYHWKIDNPKVVVQLIHGMSEHLGRYDSFAKFLNSKKIAVVGLDHRGHGKTAGKLERVGHLADSNGMRKLVQDAVELNLWIREKYKGKKVFILGHSMGSFVLRQLMHDHSETGDGYLISATGAHPGLKGSLGIKLVSIIKTFGRRNRSKLLDSIAFGDFNKKFKPKRTNKDWLSRDEKIVDDYIADDYCMQTFSSQFFYDLASIVLRVNDPKFIQKTILSKPLYFFAGDQDPVGDYGEGHKKVVEMFKDAGANKIEEKLYSEGRHEMLNEINREEVYQDIVKWIFKHS